MMPTQSIACISAIGGIAPTPGRTKPMKEMEGSLLDRTSLTSRLDPGRDGEEGVDGCEFGVA